MHNERPIRPEPDEIPKIKSAMRVARIMKWGTRPVSGLMGIVVLLIAVNHPWYIAAAWYVGILSPLILFGRLFGRCPRCGKTWGSQGPFRLFYESEDETESMVCGRCRLDIGLGLRGP